MDIEKLVENHIKEKESCRLIAYYDTSKPPVLTIGWGHRCRQSDGFSIGSTITQRYADDLLQHDLAWVYSGVRQLVPQFNSKPIPVQIVLCSMAFNNGIEGLRNFKKCLGACNENDFEKMADEIKDSDNWRRADLHSRYVELEAMVRGVK